MDFSTMGWGLFILFIFYKIGHAQGQFHCMRKLRTKTAVLYAWPEQIKNNFGHADNFVLKRVKKDDSQVAVKIIYEVEK